jgi:hypothetical protein
MVSCGCHPNCGIGTALMINKETKEAAPVPEFLDIPQMIRDIQKITDASRGKWFSNLMMGLCLLKNYKPFKSPKSLALVDLLKKFDKSFALTGETKKKYGDSSPDRTYEDALKRRSDPWNFLFIAGMWFQDLFNYDFRRTEMCIIPYATQEGEISFCAYNTGVGWRNIIENMHKNATVADWYKTHGKHEIYARGKSVNLENYEHTLSLRETDVTAVRDRATDIPMTAADEDKMRRKAAYEAKQVREIYEEMVLKKPKPDLVTIGPLAAKATNGNGHSNGDGNGHSNGNGHSSGNGNGHAELVSIGEKVTV